MQSLHPIYFGLLAMSNKHLRKLSHEKTTRCMSQLNLDKRTNENFGDLLFAVLVKHGKRPPPPVTSKGVHLVSCGNGTYGNLGIAPFNRRSPIPVSVPHLPVTKKARFVAAGGWHTLVAMDDGTVYGFGCVSKGQLGNFSPNENNVRHRAQEIVLGRNVFAKYVSAGSFHSIILTSESKGNVYAFGHNSHGQLGHGRDKGRVVADVCKVGAFASSTKMCMAACGSNHTLFLDSHGVAWGVGDNANEQITQKTTHAKRSAFYIPIQIQSGGVQGKRVVLISANTNQSAYLTVNGSLYVSGARAKQYAAMPKCKSIYGMANINLECGERVVDVSLGRRHMLLRTLNGKVKSCGDETFGQLGCKMPLPVLTPFGFTRERIPNKVHDVDLGGIATAKGQHFYLSASNSSSTIFTSRDGVFTFGCNMHTNLGHGEALTYIKLEEPRKVEALHDFEILDFSMGSSFFVAIVRSKGV